MTRLVQFLGALGIILYYDPTLAGLALLSAPVTLVVSRTLMGRMRQYSRRVREVSSQVMMFHEESFQNIQVIKSFGLSSLYSRKLRQVQGDYRQVKLEYNKFSVAASALMSLVGTVVSVVCFGWGVYRLWGGYITYGTMILFLQMASSLSASFSAIVKLVPSAISAATAAGRVMAVTELPREDRSQDPMARKLLEENRAEGIRVETRNLGFRYQGGGCGPAKRQLLCGAWGDCGPGGPLRGGEDHHAPAASGDCPAPGRPVRWWRDGVQARA